MQVEDIIAGSLRDINAIAAGETPNADEYADCLFTLNAMVSSWNIEQLSIFTITSFLQALVANQQAYTIGSGGNLNTQRPDKITAANVIIGGLTRPLHLATQADWAQIEEKGLTGVRPLELYNDYEYPLSTLKVWPIPSGTPTLELYMWQELTAFTSITDNFDFPPGYARAIRKNLAVDLATEFGKPLTQELMMIAQQSKADLRTSNVANENAVLQTQLPPPPQPQGNQG